MKEFAAEFLVILNRILRNLKEEEEESLAPFFIQDLMKQDTPRDVDSFLRISGQRIFAQLKEGPGDTNWWLQRAFIYLKKNLYTDISLEVVADQIGMSPQHLSRIFKAKYGKTVGEYIADQRMSYAKYLLSAGDFSIKDISRKIGYSDQNYFTRVFKKHTGYTPSRYRELH